MIQDLVDSPLAILVTAFLVLWLAAHGSASWVRRTRADETVHTANFFVIDDNSGTLESNYIRAPMTSAPPSGVENVPLPRPVPGKLPFAIEYSERTSW